MNEVTLLVPILPDKVEAHGRFCQEILTARREEHAESRQRLGITKERCWLQHLQHGPALVVHLEGPGAGDLLDALGRSNEPYDRWFREEVEELHGIDVARGAPELPRQAYLMTTDAPVTSKSLGLGVPLPEVDVAAWWQFCREVQARQPERVASLERCGISKEVVHLANTAEGPVVLWYFEGVSHLDELGFFSSDDAFDRWFAGNVRTLCDVDFSQPQPALAPMLVFEWTGAQPHLPLPPRAAL